MTLYRFRNSDLVVMLYVLVGQSVVVACISMAEWQTILSVVYFEKMTQKKFYMMHFPSIFNAVLQLVNT